MVLLSCTVAGIVIVNCICWELLLELRQLRPVLELESSFFPLGEENYHAIMC